MLFLRHFGIVRLMRQRQLALTQEAVPAGDQFILGRRSRRRTFGEKPMLWDYEHHPQMKTAGSWGQIVVSLYVLITSLWSSWTSCSLSP